MRESVLHNKKEKNDISLGALSPILSGVFITFEGGEGSGKSTHIGFLAETLRDRGYKVVCIREPGGTEIGEKLRDIVLDNSNDGMADITELFVYEAARAQIVHQVIIPALKCGTVVLCDRFFDSTVAYQAYGRGLDKSFIESANQLACQGVVPIRTIYLACGQNPQTGLERATHDSGADRLESAGEQFHAKVNAGFEEIARVEPDRIRRIDSTEGKNATARKVFEALTDIFPWMAEPKYCDEVFFDRILEKYYGNKHTLTSLDEVC